MSDEIYLGNRFLVSAIKVARNQWNYGVWDSERKCDVLWMTEIGLVRSTTGEYIADEAARMLNSGELHPEYDS